MKKATRTLLAAMFLCFATACGNTDTAHTSSNTEVQNSSENSETTTTTPKETEQENNGTTTEQTESVAEESQTQDNNTSSVSTFSEVIIVDNDYCTMKIMEIDEDNLWGYTLKAYIENKTADKTLMFSMDDVAVNGIMCDPFWAKSLMPGAKSNEEISFSDSKLDEYGISDIFEITGMYRVYDDDDWLADNLADDDFTIYPKGEEYAKTSSQPLSNSGNVLFETDTCKMVVLGYDSDSLYGYTMKVYLENKSDNKLMFSIEDATVNGFSADPFWAKSIPAGKSAYSDIDWSSSDFEANGITDVETITMILHVRDDDDWLGDYFINDTYTVNP